MEVIPAHDAVKRQQSPAAPLQGRPSGNKEEIPTEASRRAVRVVAPSTLSIRSGAPIRPTQETPDLTSSLLEGLAKFNKALLQYLAIPQPETLASKLENSREDDRERPAFSNRMAQIERDTTTGIVGLASLRKPTDFSQEMTNKLVRMGLGDKEDHVYMPWLGIVGKKGSRL